MDYLSTIASVVIIFLVAIIVLFLQSKKKISPFNDRDSILTELDQSSGNQVSIGPSLKSLLALSDPSQSHYSERVALANSGSLLDILCRILDSCLLPRKLDSGNLLLVLLILKNLVVLDEMKSRIEEQPQIIFCLINLLREVLEPDRKDEMAESAAEIQVIFTCVRISLDSLFPLFQKSGVLVLGSVCDGRNNLKTILVDGGVFQVRC